MAKRAGRDTLTGGTGDVNPQYLQGAVSMVAGAANTPVEVAVGLPILRPGMGASQQKAQVVELLKAWCYLPPPVAGTDVNVGTAQFLSTLSMSTAAQGTTVPNLSNPRVQAQFRQSITASFTAAGTQYSAPVGVQCWDFTDGAGHGILIGTDNMYMQYDNDGFTSVLTATWKIAYRFKEVPLIEYIGMVQSQQ